VRRVVRSEMRGANKNRARKVGVEREVDRRLRPSRGQWKLSNLKSLMPQWGGRVFHSKLQTHRAICTISKKKQNLQFMGQPKLIPNKRGPAVLEGFLAQWKKNRFSKRTMGKRNRLGREENRTT